MTLDEAARLAGGFRWAESRLFEILGGWVQSTPEPDAKLALDRHSQHHAWRAQQWWDRLPVVAGIDRDQLVVAISAGADAAFAQLAGLEGTISRLAGAYRFGHARLASAYFRALAAASPVSEGSIVRTLDLVAHDLARDWQEGEALLQGLLDGGGGHAIDVAGQTLTRLERQWVEGGGGWPAN